MKVVKAARFACPAASTCVRRAPAANSVSRSARRSTTARAPARPATPGSNSRNESGTNFYEWARRRRAGAQNAGAGRDVRGSPIQLARAPTRLKRRRARGVRRGMTPRGEAGEAARSKRSGGASGYSGEPRAVVRPESDKRAARARRARMPDTIGCKCARMPRARRATGRGGWTTSVNATATRQDLSQSAKVLGQPPGSRPCGRDSDQNKLIKLRGQNPSASAFSNAPGRCKLVDFRCGDWRRAKAPHSKSRLRSYASQQRHPIFGRVDPHGRLRGHRRMQQVHSRQIHARC